MQKKNPKQHTHNWEWKLTGWTWERTPNDPYSPGGFHTRRYWACIRGGKVKHTERMRHPERSIFGGILEENVFIRASGVMYGENSS